MFSKENTRQQNNFITETLGEGDYTTKVVSSPNVIGDESRTFSDENFRFQIYILSSWCLFLFSYWYYYLFLLVIWLSILYFSFDNNKIFAFHNILELVFHEIIIHEEHLMIRLQKKVDNIANGPIWKQNQIYEGPKWGEKKTLKFKGQKYTLISTFFSPHFHDLCHLPMLRM